MNATPSPAPYDRVVANLQRILRDCTIEQINQALSVVPPRHTKYMGLLPLSMTSIDRMDAVLTAALDRQAAETAERRAAKKELRQARYEIAECQRQVEAIKAALNKDSVEALARQLRGLADAIAGPEIDDGFGDAG